MKILAFFDPSPEQQDTAVEIAVALADYCISDRRELDLVCNEATALEIGVAVLGMIDAPTVEGGERRTSPLRILGLIGSPEEATAPTEVDAENILDPLDQLRADGIFSEAEGKFSDLARTPRPAQAMQDLIRHGAREADIVFGLGAHDALWRAAAEGVRERRGSLVGIDKFMPRDLSLGTGLKTLDLLDLKITPEREEGMLDEDARRVSIQARRVGQAVGTLLAFICAKDAAR